MSALTKKRKSVINKVETGKLYPLDEAVNLISKISTTKFNASVDIDVRLGVDPRKANQMVRGTLSLPNGTGKEKSVLVFCTPDKEEEAKNAGAEYVGLEKYIEKVKGGWTDVDVVVAMPQVMGQVGKLGRILGPRSLMPNPKSGTVTMDIGNTVKQIKKGKITFKVDKYGIIHSSIGRVSFEPNKLDENITEFIKTLIKNKPVASKGTYILSIYISSTMSSSIQIDPKSIKK